MASPKKPSAPTDAPPSEPKPIAAAVEAALQPASAPEVVHDDPVAEDPVHLPVRRDGPEVHDAHVSLRRDLLDDFGFLSH